ncbi:uncharacterized protein LOC115326583 [Ixodes scapularis]|uniref:uncharacterized protein LOC115326583 n=1 Tax=Ixodes scapularis TaxID=6945 RepID=UPI001A9DBFC7|nr:uncharacterized protein LOC115326583 [Ixodes scapularis]
MAGSHWSTGAAESAKKKKYAVKTEVLLDLIKQYPCLHDKRHPKYKDNAYKDELWGNLGVDLGGVEGSVLANKFKNAKDSYQKQKNKISDSMKSGAGAGEVIKITWPHYVHMMEIMEPASPTPSLHTNLGFYGEMSSGTSSGSTTSGTNDGSGYLEERSADEQNDDQCEPPEERRASGVTGGSPMQNEQRRARQSPASKSRPEESGSGTQDAIGACVGLLQSIQERRTRRAENCQDVVHHFSMSIAGRLGTLDERSQLQAMHEIENVVFSAQMQAICR